MHNCIVQDYTHDWKKKTKEKRPGPETTYSSHRNETSFQFHRCGYQLSFNSESLIFFICTFKNFSFQLFYNIALLVLLPFIPFWSFAIFCDISCNKSVPIAVRLALKSAKHEAKCFIFCLSQV